MSYLVARYVDGDDLLAAEVPLEARREEGRHEATARSIDVDGNVKSTLDQDVVDSLDVFVVPCDMRLAPVH